jgi:quercetin dioxygenase-like cupin family protein
LKYTAVYLDSAQKTHFKEAEVDFQSVNFAPPAPPVDLSSYTPVSQMVFFRIPVGWFGDWHPAPKRQFFFCLSGQLEITVSDGEKRLFRPGDVFLLEDIVGKGHQTRVVGDVDYIAAIVQVATST